ncbi:MAG: N-formylglutamate amidohydrolase [Clostridia bacterium]|nr:N-formylglutamate amidohydrolase [Clostridia bacterium]
MYRIMSDCESSVSVWNRERHELPFVISIPHSGVCITDGMAQNLKSDAILANMDWYLPELYDFLADMGFTVMVNRVSRYVIDPNRELAGGKQADYTKALIYEKTTFGRDLYQRALSEGEVQERIDRFYKAYHQTLQDLIAEKQKYFDRVYLLDLHSFGKELEADVVLGNNDGGSMNERLLLRIGALFSANQYSVALNRPFRGGHIVRHYGCANGRCEALQIELAYRAYIAKRNIGEEAFPRIDSGTMQDGRERLRRIFEALKRDILTGALVPEAKK